MRLADVQIRLAGGNVVARVTGDLDMSNAEDVGAMILEATPNEAEGVVLDLSGVEFMDSAGIYVVYGVRARLHARGQSLVLVVPTSSPVHDALRLAGIKKAGQMVETVDGALRTLDSGSSGSAS
jgi:anti-anti-sigma factor